MARRRGSVAPASTRRCKIPLSMLQHGLHNLPHSSKHVDVLELMLRCSRLVGQLPSGLSGRPVPLTRAGTSSRAAGVARRTGSMHVSLGRMPWCHGGPSRAGRGVGAFATRARCVGGGVGRSSPSVRLHAVLGGGSHCQLVRTGFWRQMVPRHRGGELLRQRHLSRSGLSGPRARP